MAQTVVLLHTQPGKPDHYDWLIDQPHLQTECRLITFRVPVRPDLHHEFVAEKAPDHRAIYLDYEGELTRNRGKVTRVLDGQIEQLNTDRDRLTAVVVWNGVRSNINASCIDPGTNRWRFEITPLKQH